jgi:hypothetical protein
MWYITFRLNWLLKVTYMASQFRIEPFTDNIRCIPKKSVVQKRDAEIARLQAGDMPNIDLQAFSKEYNELYPSSTDLRDYITTLPNVFSVKSTAISETWLYSFSEKCAQFLDVHGYVDFTVRTVYRQDHFCCAGLRVDLLLTNVLTDSSFVDKYQRLFPRGLP